MKLKIYPLLILITCYLFACTSNKTEEISPEIKKVLQEAYQLYLQEKYVQAESLLVANDCLNIPSADAMELMAKIRVAQIKHDEAVDFYRRTIKYEPDRRSAWLGLINSLQELGQLEEAAKTLQKAQKKFSNDPNLLYQGGQLAIKQGQFKQAAGLLEKAIHQDSTLVQAYYALANAYFRLGKKEAGDKMMKHYRELSEKVKDLELDYRIARLNPGSAEAHYNLARAYERVRDYPHAIAEYKRTIDLNPNFPEAYNNLGILFFRFNKYQEAEILFKQAVSLSDTTAKYHFNLGAVYARTGKLDQARYHWQQALRLDPGYEKARRFLQRLEKN